MTNVVQRRIFKATEPSSAEAAQRQRELAEAMAVRSMRGSQVGAGNYSPTVGLADLAGGLFSLMNMNKANKAFGRAKEAESTKRSAALKGYMASVPDDQVGAEARRRIMDPSLPADELPEPVEPRSAATQNLMGTLDEQTQQQMVSALLANEMKLWEPQKPLEVSPGASLVRPKAGGGYESLFTAPTTQAKRNVEYRDAGDRLVPVYSDTGEPAAGVQPIRKGQSPGTAGRAPGVTMSDQAIDFAAKRLLNGEPANKVLANFGRGMQGAQNITAVQNKLAELASTGGVSPEAMAVLSQELAADSRTRLELGAREGKVAARVEEAKQFASIAGQASLKVPRGQFLPVSKLLQFSDTQLNNPDLAAFKAANVSLINAYAAAVGGGVPTVHDKEAAEKMLSTAQSPEAYQAVINQLVTEMDAALAAPRNVMEEMRHHDLGGEPGQPGPVAPTPGVINWAELK